MIKCILIKTLRKYKKLEKTSFFYLQKMGSHLTHMAMLSSYSKFCIQESLLVGWRWGAYGILGIKPESATYKVNTLLDELSL